MGEKQTIRLISQDGTETVIEIDKDLYDQFAARAKELGRTVNELFLIALGTYLEKKGY